MPPPGSLPTPSSVVSRSLYTYVTRAVYGQPSGGEPLDAEDVGSRALYLYVSRSTHGHPGGGEPLDPDDVLSRALYLYVSRAHDRDPSDVAARALYAYVEFDSTALFPWIAKIEPVEQARLGQVAVYGDGFGASEAAEGGIVRLGLYDPTQLGPGAVMGVVSWASRSVGLYPANAGVPLEPALVVTVPVDGDSGMLSVEETT